MDFEHSPDTLMLREMVQRFVAKDARPLEARYFTTGRLEPAERARLRKSIDQMGLWGATVPEAYGGAGLDTLSACVIAEELGKTFIPVELGEVPPLLYACQEGQIEQYLEPALAGERRAFLALREPDALRPEEWKTRVEPQDGGYRLSGCKLIAGLPSQEDFFVVFAWEPQGLSAFLLDADLPGVEIETGKEVRLFYRDCLLGADARLGESGKALSLGADEAPRAWIRLGARYVGLAERLIEMATGYANEWVALGEPLKARLAVRRMLADMRVKVDSARWLVYHAAWLADQGKPLRLPAAEVRLATCEMLKKVEDLTTMIYGGPGPAAADIHHLIHSALPAEALELALDAARFVIAEEMLTTQTG